jgi:orotidine-5'-phosphate decarboxylase
MENFADRLLREIDRKENLGIVGLDPDVEFIPQCLQDRALDIHGESFEAVGHAFFEYNKLIIDYISDIVPAVKPQMAFYEIYKSPGIEAFDNTVRYARSKGLIVIEDCKRNDVGNTAKKYSEGHIGMVKMLRRKGEERKSFPSFDLDAVTVDGYIGSDCVLEFARDCKEYGKGIFVLDRTSNPSSVDLQNQILDDGLKVSERMAHLINSWGQGTQGDEGYNSVGAVVGATWPPEARSLRRIMNSNIFLVPGYGAQGGKPADMPTFVNADGRGAIVSSSRGVIAAYREKEYMMKYGEENFYKAARDESIKMKDEINEALCKSGKSRW